MENYFLLTKKKNIVAVFLSSNFYFLRSSWLDILVNDWAEWSVVTSQLYILQAWSMIVSTCCLRVNLAAILWLFSSISHKSIAQWVVSPWMNVSCEPFISWALMRRPTGSSSRASEYSSSTRPTFLFLVSRIYNVLSLSIRYISVAFFRHRCSNCVDLKSGVTIDEWYWIIKYFAFRYSVQYPASLGTNDTSVIVIGATCTWRFD